MPASQKDNWVYIPLALCAISFFFSRSLLSVSTGLMLAVVIYDLFRGSESHLKQQLNSNRWLFLLLGLWILFILLDGFRGGLSKPWFDELLLKIPLIVVPAYLLALPMKSKMNEWCWMLFVSLNSFVAFGSTINYLMNYDEINELLLQSRHIPILGNSHHIYFGVVSAMSIWLSFFYAKASNYRMFWRINLVILLVLMHILASRTGLLGFYASVGFYLIHQAVISRKYKLLIVGMGMIVFLPIGGYYLSTSFHNKVHNSLEDFEALRSGEDINYKSLAMRVEAWKTSYHLFSDHLLFGVGLTEVEGQLQKQYVKDRTTLFRENRIGPHNQFLEVGLAHGIGVVLVLIGIFVLLFRRPQAPTEFYALVVVLLFTFLLESFLERQQGIMAFGLFCFGAFAASGVNPKET